jgi:hypothetical protein
MKSQVLILAVLMIALLGCKKDIVSPTEPECLYVERDTSFWRFPNNISFYYNNDKKNIGRAFYERQISFTSSLPYYTPAFDSTVYVSNTKVVTYHYPVALNALSYRFNKDTIPLHSTVYSTKTEFTYQNNRIIRIEYFDRSASFLRDSLVYEADKLVNIYKFGTIEIPNLNSGSQRIYALDYDGNNLKSLISVTKDYNGTIMGRDTTLYFSYSNLKNPNKKFTHLPDLFIASISPNVCDSVAFTYSYNYNGGWSYGSTTSKLTYTDNGKGYPKEAGIYKCD